MKEIYLEENKAWWLTRLAAGHLSAVAWLDGYFLKKTAEIHSNAWALGDTTEWVGQASFLYNGMILALGGLGVLLAHRQRKQREQEESLVGRLKSQLPVLKDGVSGATVRERLKVLRRDEDSYRNYIAESAFWLRPFVDKTGSNELEFYSTLLESTANLAHELAEGLDERRSSRVYQATKATWLLDELAPISLECPLTPHSGDDEDKIGRKYWYEFILREAFAIQDARREVMASGS